MARVYADQTILGVSAIKSMASRSFVAVVQQRTAEGNVLSLYIGAVNQSKPWCVRVVVER
jgi:hypothetical protein